MKCDLSLFLPFVCPQLSPQRRPLCVLRKDHHLTHSHHLVWAYAVYVPCIDACILLMQEIFNYYGQWRYGCHTYCCHVCDSVFLVIYLQINIITQPLSIVKYLSFVDKGSPCILTSHLLATEYCPFIPSSLVTLSVGDVAPYAPNSPLRLHAVQLICCLYIFYMYIHSLLFSHCRPSADCLHEQTNVSYKERIPFMICSSGSTLGQNYRCFRIIGVLEVGYMK